MVNLLTHLYKRLGLSHLISAGIFQVVKELHVNEEKKLAKILVMSDEYDITNVDIDPEIVTSAVDYLMIKRHNYCNKLKERLREASVSFNEFEQKSPALTILEQLKKLYPDDSNIEDIIKQEIEILKKDYGSDGSLGGGGKSKKRRKSKKRKSKRKSKRRKTRRKKR